MRKLKDTIYYDDEITIIKKYADELGTFIPGDMWSLLFIATEELDKWAGAGMDEKSLESLKKTMIKRIKDLK